LSDDVVRVVGIGGGTGLPLLMRGLAQLQQNGEVENLALTAIVCVSDDGGSSGRLRQSFRVPALGDARNCLIGLKRRDSIWSELLGYRFGTGRGLAGHSLGNLMLTALCQQTGSVRKAIELVAEAMEIAGTVLPATETPVTLAAESSDGRRAHGECAIAAARMRIARVWLEPESPAPSRGVVEALEAADLVVLGPGSLFTSVIPPLLTAGVADAIQRSSALRIYVCNLMAQPGETDGFTAADHVRALQRYLGEGSIDACVLNTRQPHGHVAQRYRAAGATPVEHDVATLRELGPAAIEADLLACDEPKARHEPLALGRLLLGLVGAARSRVMMRNSRKVETVCVESSAT
jgi:uncharacterized cofD-like protein